MDALVDLARIDNVLDEALTWSRGQNYRGYNKHDGLNSPILASLCGWHKWTRILAIQTVMRCPINLRPLLAVPKTLNPKGVALFAQAYLDRYRRTGQGADLESARALLDLLKENRSRGEWQGSAWGYHYPWQDPGFHAPAGTPNAVVTAFVCEAFLDAHELTSDRQYLEITREAIGFLLHELPVLKDTESELCLAYMPFPINMRVMDVSILIGAVLARYGKCAGVDEYRGNARRLINYVVNRQTEYGAWFYTDPPGDSHITHDNYHTGFILDALWRYMQATGEREWETAYFKGLDFYARNHFTPMGAPKWMHDCEYPYDIHGAAQGILTFSRHGREYPGLADRILAWTIDNMYAGGGRFNYQIHRWYRKNYTLLRWCNAWMCRALASYLLHRGGNASTC